MWRPFSWAAELSLDDRNRTLAAEKPGWHESANVNADHEAATEKEATTHALLQYDGSERNGDDWRYQRSLTKAGLTVRPTSTDR